MSELDKLRAKSIDVVYMVGSGCTFGTVACLAYDLQASWYTCLIYQSFVVLTRALVVPSSSTRTAIVSSLAFVPIVIGAIVLVVVTDQHGINLGVPRLAFLAPDAWSFLRSSPPDAAC